MGVSSTAALIQRAESVLKPSLRGDRWFADVGAAVESATGRIYVGVAIDLSSRASVRSRPRLAGLSRGRCKRMEKTTAASTRGTGRILLWIGLVLSLVLGGMFLAVAVTSSGYVQTGGLMIAIPAALIAGLCAFGLSRGSRSG